MADYCTVAEVKAIMPDASISTTTDTDAIAKLDAAVGSFITSASRMIDRYIGKWANYFYPSTDAETRYFDGCRGAEQEIDEVVSITSVSVAESGGTGSTDYTAWGSTDYLEYPYNHSEISCPIYRLIIDRNGSKPGWYTYRKAVKVVGIFGYSTTPPADVKLACQIQAMRWYMRGKQAFQDSGVSANLGEMFYVQALDPDVKTLLWNYQIGGMV